MDLPSPIPNRPLKLSVTDSEFASGIDAIALEEMANVGTPRRESIQETLSDATIIQSLKVLEKGVNRIFDAQEWTAIDYDYKPDNDDILKPKTSKKISKKAKLKDRNKSKKKKKKKGHRLHKSDKLHHDPSNKSKKSKKGHHKSSKSDKLHKSSKRKLKKKSPKKHKNAIEKHVQLNTIKEDDLNGIDTDEKQADIDTKIAVDPMDPHVQIDIETDQKPIKIDIKHKMNQKEWNEFITKYSQYIYCMNRDINDLSQLFTKKSNEKSSYYSIKTPLTSKVHWIALILCICILLNGVIVSGIMFVKFSMMIWLLLIIGSIAIPILILFVYIVTKYVHRKSLIDSDNNTNSKQHVQVWYCLLFNMESKCIEQVNFKLISDTNGEEQLQLQCVETLKHVVVCLFDKMNIFCNKINTENIAIFEIDFGETKAYQLEYKMKFDKIDNKCLNLVKDKYNEIGNKLKSVGTDDFKIEIFTSSITDVVVINT